VLSCGQSGPWGGGYGYPGFDKKKKRGLPLIICKERRSGKMAFNEAKTKADGGAVTRYFSSDVKSVATSPWGTGGGRKGVEYEIYGDNRASGRKFSWHVHSVKLER